MNGPSFKLRVLTAAKVFERDVSYLRLKDETGYFGIMKGHTDFITAIVPSLGYYTDVNGREVYLAANGGIFSVRDGIATLSASELFESDNAEMLSGIIKLEAAKGDTTEAICAIMIKNIERMFIEKALRSLRER